MSGTKSSWPEVPLGDILTYVGPLIDLDDSKEYVTITVKRRHGGLEARERLFGYQIKTKKQFRPIPGAFILSRIQCWHQAYAIVPEEIPGNMIVSTNYDQFVISPSVDRRFFWWFSHSPLFTETVRSSAFGVVIEKMVFNRDAWLGKRIPLPPLDEQHRIVSRIEGLAAKVDQAKRLRLQSGENVQKVISSVLERMFPEGADTQFSYRSIRDAVVEHKQGFYTSGKLPVGDVYFARITDINDHGYLDYSGMPRVTIDDGTLGSFRVHTNDFLFARTGGAGRFALANKEASCIFASYLIRFRFRPDYMPEFLRYYFWSPRFQNEIRSRIHGGANQNIHAEDIKNATLPVIPLARQRDIVAHLDDLQAKVYALKTLQSETAAELDALMPSILSRTFRGEL